MTKDPITGLREALIEAIAELNLYSIDETGEEYNNPRFNEALAATAPAAIQPAGGAVHSYCMKLADGSFDNWKDCSAEHAAHVMQAGFADGFKVRTLYTAPVSAPVPEARGDSSDKERLLWCLRTVRAIADLGRDELGEWYPQAVMVCGTLKRVLGDTPEAIEAGTSERASIPEASEIKTWKQRLYEAGPKADHLEDYAQRLVSTKHMLAEISDLRDALTRQCAPIATQGSIGDDAEFVDLLIKHGVLNSQPIAEIVAHIDAAITQQQRREGGNG